MKKFFERFFPESEDPIVNATILILLLCIVALFVGSLISAFSPRPEPGTCSVCIHKCKPFAVSSCHLESEGVSCACDVEKRE